MSSRCRQSDNSRDQSSIQNITKNRTDDSFSWFYDFDSREHTRDLERYIFSSIIYASCFLECKWHPCCYEKMISRDSSEIKS